MQRIQCGIRMATIVFSALFLLCLLVFLTNPAVVAAQESAPVTTVLLVRHADKLDNTDNSPLSDAGKARAKKLVSVAGWAGVKAIYSTKVVRALDTAGPLAECLGLKPIAYNDVKSLVEELVTKHSGQVVLVVSHTDWIQETIDALAGPGSSDRTDSEYDSFQVLTMRAPGKASLLRLKYGEAVTPAPCAK
jgi:2,3-bisphosphoglycerate-dependent phosphoglycerate mutase